MSRFPVRNAWIALVVVAGSSAAEEIVLRTHVGTAANQRFGAHVDGGRDVDADGVPDLLVADSSDFSGARVRVFSGSNGALLHDIGPSASDESFGAAVALLGDQDGDGRSEFAIGSPRARVAGLIVGKIRIHSGATGAVLRTFAGSADGDRLGTVLNAAGDLDGDSVPDLLAGDPDSAQNGPASGRVILYSGATGNVVSTYAGAQGDDLGWSFASLGDHDADGWNDYAVAAPVGDVPAVNRGYVRVVSSRTGAVLLQVGGTVVGGWFGTSLASVGDVDGDGLRDLLVGEPESDFLATNCGRLHAVSTATGSFLWSISPVNQAHARFGQELVSLGDVDGDGVTDAATGAPDEDVPGPGTNAGRVRILSAATGTIFEVFSGTQGASAYGLLAPAGDVDGDGRLDFAIATPGWDVGGGSDFGRVRVVAGRFCEATSFCAAFANSTGQAASISVVGSLSVAANHMTLRATGLPPNAAGAFYYGAQSAFVPFGNGIRCIGGTVYRLGVTAAHAGVLEMTPDLAHPPSPGGTISAGSSWYFQAWFRDSAPSAAPFHFNLSDGVRVSVCP